MPKGTQKTVASLPVKGLWVAADVRVDAFLHHPPPLAPLRSTVAGPLLMIHAGMWSPQDLSDLVKHEKLKTIVGGCTRAPPDPPHLLGGGSRPPRTPPF